MEIGRINSVITVFKDRRLSRLFNPLFALHPVHLLAIVVLDTAIASSLRCHIYDCVILCHCTLAAALYFEQSSCDELMEFKQIQTRAQPEESLKQDHSCTNLSPE